MDLGAFSCSRKVNQFHVQGMSYLGRVLINRLRSKRAMQCPLYP